LGLRTVLDTLRRTNLSIHPSCYPAITLTVVLLPGHKADKLLSSSLDVKTVWKYTSISHMSCLIKHRCTFAFLPIEFLVQSVYRLAMACMVWESNPGGGEVFRTRPECPWSLPNEYCVFPGSKLAGVWH
jgi:hypothetical protein